jgi:mRNA interferase MazF
VSTRPQRGDVWQVEFGRPVGNEQGAGLRPAVVISKDGFNDSGAGLAIVAPLTTAQRNYPSRVRIRPGASGMRDTSWAAVEHLRSVSVLRLRECRGAVDDHVLEAIDEVLGFMLLQRSDGR